MGCDGGETSRQSPELRYIFTCDAIFAELVYKFDGTGDRGAVSAIYTWYIFGCCAAFVCSNSSWTDIAYNVGE